MTHTEIEPDVSSVAGSGPKDSISFWVSGFFGSPSERSHLGILHSSYTEQLPPASAMTETPRSDRFLVLAEYSSRISYTQGARPRSIAQLQRGAAKIHGWRMTADSLQGQS
ncbi:hypothetical protein DER46DRAFT_574658 [Fusarium sp. MPI-SDFR-AT-0072]|nr:hypothetical protein DER46DRAFT_574658 [Fusarium sp. MPI-SDFR-AT-0072]